MPLDATVQIMQAKSEQIKIRTSYNVSAMNFTPKELAKEIQQHIPKFSITYKTRL